MPLLRYFAAVRAEAAVSEERVTGATLAEALDAARASRDGRFSQVLSICSFLVDGTPVGSREHPQVQLTADSTVDCLPPFAGG